MMWCRPEIPTYHLPHLNVTQFVLFQKVGQLLEPVYSITLSQLLNYITEDTVLLKVDTEGSECRVSFMKQLI